MCHKKQDQILFKRRQKQHLHGNVQWICAGAAKRDRQIWKYLDQRLLCTGCNTQLTKSEKTLHESKIHKVCDTRLVAHPTTRLLQPIFLRPVIWYFTQNLRQWAFVRRRASLEIECNKHTFAAADCSFSNNEQKSFCCLLWKGESYVLLLAFQPLYNSKMRWNCKDFENKRW